MKRCLLILLLLISGCAAPQVVELPVMNLVPGTTVEMQRPGFWISRLDAPDELIMDQAAIAALNAGTLAGKSTVKDVPAYPGRIDAAEIRSSLVGTLSWVKKRGYYLADGNRAGDSYFKALAHAMNLNDISGEVRFGFITAYTAQRVLPAEAGLYKQDLDLNFDRLQNSALDVGTPLAVLHASDGWYYVRSPLSRGWVRAQDVALCSRERMIEYLGLESCIVTAAKADIFNDEALRDFSGFGRMGARLSLLEADARGVAVLRPVRAQDGSCIFLPGWVAADQVSLGVLPYTQRNIINQAFKLLHSPYGWGGMHGEQDCSRFLQEVFATVGIVLPRNSGLQAQVGQKVARWDADIKYTERRLTLVEKGVPAATTLRSNGHIMLYLGAVQGVPFVIHDMWGYADMLEDDPVFRLVGRVAVTTLLIGEQSKAGSLLEKIIDVRLLQD